LDRAPPLDDAGHMTTALVTGANKGIGLEIVRQLVDRNITVHLGARDPERGEKAAADTGARFVQLDVTDQDSVRRAAASIERLDVLVNNAGINGGQFVLPGGVDLDVIKGVFETNVYGVVRVTEAFLPLLRQSAHPRIVNVSSSVGTLAGMLNNPMPVTLAYVPSKTALNAMTVQYAKALPEMKVNVACPGWCATDFTRHQAPRTAAQGATIAVTLATLDDDGPTGGFYDDDGVVAW
jgi:NAD(P)-dependent dehydrogenase (short-subunit alcohol dehydrogenase family)